MPHRLSGSMTAFQLINVKVLVRVCQTSALSVYQPSSLAVTCPPASR